MSFVILNLHRELADLNLLINQSSDFVGWKSSGRWAAEFRTLKAVLSSNQNGEFEFGFGSNFALNTNPSTEYKGSLSGNGAHPISAEFKFRWKVRKLDQTQNEYFVLSGAADVILLNQAGELQRHFHYDICAGGTNENVGRAVHPFSHFQYKDGKLCDLPRVPSLIFTPTDVLEQVFIELWPISWPRHCRSNAGRAALSRHFVNQKKRIEIVAGFFVNQVRENPIALRGLQSTLPEALRLD